MVSELVDRPPHETMLPDSVPSGGVIVLGMHRSGTSAVASFLDACGFPVVGERVPADAGNPKGHFEARSVVDAHDRFLTDIGRSWVDPHPIPRSSFEGPAAARARESLVAYLDSLPDHSAWTIKDPRMCRLLPLWESLLDGTQVRFLHVVRHPAAVASSLRRRDRLSFERACQIWLRSHLESESATRSLPRSWISFDAIAEISERQRVADFLSLGSAWSEAVDDLYEPSAHGHPPSDLALHPWVHAAWSSLLDLRNGEASTALADLDRLGDSVRRASALFFPSDGWAEGSHGQRYLHLRQAMDLQQRAVEAQRCEIDAWRQEVQGVLSLGGWAESKTREIDRTQQEQLKSVRTELESVAIGLSELQSRFGSYGSAADESRRRLELRHTELLDRSLSFASTLESELREAQQAHDESRSELLALRKNREVEGQELVRLRSEVLKQRESTLKERARAESEWLRRARLADEELRALNLQHEATQNAGRMRIAELERELDSSRARASAADHEVHLLRSRRSWRYTRVFRRLIGLLQRGSAR